MVVKPFGLMSAPENLNMSLRRTMKMYNLVVLMGEAGAGKDSMMQAVLEKLAEKGHIADIHEIVSCTTRPMREGEKHGVNYFYLTNEEFAERVINGQMFESTIFNDWCYGTSVDSVDDSVVNIGVFNPEGIEILSHEPQVDLTVYYICATAKNRLIRQLNREENPDVNEIIRRYKADYEDFYDLEFEYQVLPNDTMEDYEAAIKKIMCQL
jgi:guanylate kinase